jgi:uncharacterized protein (DUF1501 family)
VSHAPRHQLDRRSFLRGALCVPFAGALPLGAAARSELLWLPRGDARTLVVIELQGGNDGLNTVIPVDDERYARARPTLQAVRKGAHRLADGTALHPALGRLHAHVAAGRATVVHGVGHAQPDRSHFRSRDIWHTADPAHQRVTAATTGWLGRTADLLAAASAGVPAAAVGGLEVPLVMKAQRVHVPSLRRVEDYQWGAPGGGPLPAGAAVRQVVARAAEPGGDSLRGFTAAVAQQGVGLADELTRALARYRPRAEYPDTPLGRELRLCAQLVVAGFGTRLVHVATGGFDTHARQLGTHAGLLQQLDAALGAFLADLVAHERADSVALLVHSEFGRRVAENASQGTDHGAAGPVFVALGGSCGGVLGAPPDLARLDDGDLIAGIDFRSVYAELLQWLGVAPAAVLGAPLPPVGLWTPASRR